MRYVLKLHLFSHTIHQNYYTFRSFYIVFRWFLYANCASI